MDNHVGPLWRKSTYTGTEGNSRTELGQDDNGVLVRDTTR
jgi:hypothetical protein